MRVLGYCPRMYESSHEAAAPGQRGYPDSLPSEPKAKLEQGESPSEVAIPASMDGKALFAKRTHTVDGSQAPCSQARAEAQQDQDYTTSWSQPRARRRWTTNLAMSNGDGAADWSHHVWALRSEDWQDTEGDSVEPKSSVQALGSAMDTDDSAPQVVLVASADEALQALAMTAATVRGSVTVVWTGKLLDDCDFIEELQAYKAGVQRFAADWGSVRGCAGFDASGEDFALSGEGSARASSDDEGQEDAWSAQATLGDFASERADAHDSLSAIAGQVRLGLPALRQSPS
eukprot:s4755_g2.t1